MSSPLSSFSAIQTAHHCIAACLILNIEHLIEEVGIDKVAFLTVTLTDKALNPKQAPKRLQRFLSKLRGHFGDWVWVMEFGTERRLHFHLLLVCPGNIRAGFDPAGYDEIRMLTSERRCGFLGHQGEARLRRLKKASNVNPILRRARKDIRKALRGTKGFGYIFELTPIRTNAARMAGYFEKNYYRAVEGRHGQYKGTRLVGYTTSFPRVCRPCFAPVDSRARFYYKAIGQALGVSELPNMRPLYGDHWAYDLRPAIVELRTNFGVDPAGWPIKVIVMLAGRCLDPLKGPEDAADREARAAAKASAKIAKAAVRAAKAAAKAAATAAS
jgi:hypothetical protein